VTLKTSYEFTLPRGYVDHTGSMHRTGTMRLATARDELAPLRDPTVTGPDDPRLTILVLARVVETLGDMSQVTPHDIEGLFAVDLAFLQDFYGVINFGSQEEYDALISAQRNSPLLGDSRGAPPVEPEPAGPVPDDTSPPVGAADEGPAAAQSLPRTPMRHAVEELPRRAQ
jgi:hypothetical protein